MDYEFCKVRSLYARLTVEKTAQLFGVSPRTVKKWDQTNEPPQAVKVAIDLLGGDLGELLGPKWSKWRFCRDGCIVTPDGQCVSPGDICAIHYQRQLTAEYKRQIKQAFKHGHARQCKTTSRGKSAGSVLQFPVSRQSESDRPEAI